MNKLVHKISEENYLVEVSLGLQKLAEWLKGSAHECLSSCKASPLNENTAVRADL